MSPVALPFIPSSDTGRIELLSDHTSPTRDELREAERMIFADDAIVSTKKQPEVGSQNSDPMLLDSESLGDIYSPLKGIAERPSSSPTPRQSLQDRKVEVPLSPPTSEQPPPWKRKSVSFREALTDLIHDLPPPIPRPENVSSDDIDAIFEETIRPIGIKAERRVEQEQLQEADTTLRVPVPIMDFSLPIAPWKLAAQSSTTTSEETWKTLLSEMKDLHFSKHFWPLSGKVERELKWTPFPAALGKVGTQETISDDNSIEKYLAQPERVNIDTLTWKPEGLRILDDLAVSDEELEEGSFPEERDIDSLIRKRKYEFQADESSSPPLDDENEKAKARYRCDSKGQRQRQPIDHAGTMTGPFSALNALDTYMSVRKGEVEPPILTATKHFSKPSNENPTQPPPKATIPTNPPLLPQNPRSIPTPPLTIPSTPSPFVISASFLSNRKLTRQITHLYPSANLIERDFNLHLDTTPDPSTKPTTQSTISDEADILLSPSTGLIITTLQKIKQRSLPGQAARSAVRDRITRTSPRYERLIILVSEARSLPDSVGNELDTSDCEALIELTAFCSTLQTDIQITFVAGGDEDVAKWIVPLMVKYHVIDPELQLIQDETLWEVFLRRAGMNAFAAQVILAGLKAPTANEDDLNGNGEGVCGLTAFVKMGVGERAARFERVLGGREVLGRVSRVLDARW